MEWGEIQKVDAVKTQDNEGDIIGDINGTVTKFKDLFWDKQTVSYYVVVFVFFISILCIFKTMSKLYSNKKKTE